MGARYVERHTGATLTIGKVDGRPGLWMREVLAAFPVALLERV